MNLVSHSIAIPAKAVTPQRLSLELFLVFGLPLMSVAVGATLAFYAYTQGFTNLAAAPAAESTTAASH